MTKISLRRFLEIKENTKTWRRKIEKKRHLTVKIVLVVETLGLVKK